MSGIFRRLLQEPAVHTVADGEIIRVHGGGWAANYDVLSAFIISLECANGDVAYQFNVRNDKKYIGRNAYIGGVWGTPETDGVYPAFLVSTSPLMIDFTRSVKTTEWQVTVNGHRESAFDFSDRSDCGVVSATVTKNVKNGSVSLVTEADATFIHLDGLGFAVGICVMICLSGLCLIMGKLCTIRACKKLKLRLQNGSKGSDEEQQGFLEEGEAMENRRKQWNSGEALTATEWLFQDSSGTNGPFSNSQMVALFAETDIHPGTKVKLAWLEHFVSLSTLYPKGEEFVSLPQVASGGSEDLRSVLLGNDDSTNPPGLASEVYEANAGKDDKTLGIVPLNQPPGKVEIKRVDAKGWATLAGLEAGHNILKINGISCDDMTPDSFKEAMKPRPLNFVLEKPALGLWGIRWYYSAPSVSVGPIDTGTMRYYFLRKFIHESTKVKVGLEGDFFPLSEFFPDLTQAFVTEPTIPKPPIVVSIEDMLQEEKAPVSPAGSPLQEEADVSTGLLASPVESVALLEAVATRSSTSSSAKSDKPQTIGKIEEDDLLAKPGKEASSKDKASDKAPQPAEKVTKGAYGNARGLANKAAPKQEKAGLSKGKAAAPKQVAHKGTGDLDKKGKAATKANDSPVAQEQAASGTQSGTASELLAAPEAPQEMTVDESASKIQSAVRASQARRESAALALVNGSTKAQDEPDTASKLPHDSHTGSSAASPSSPPSSKGGPTTNSDEKPKASGHSNEKPKASGHSNEKPKASGQSHEKPKASCHSNEKPKDAGHRFAKDAGHSHEKPKDAGHSHEKPKDHSHEKPKDSATRPSSRARTDDRKSRHADDRPSPRGRTDDKSSDDRKSRHAEARPSPRAKTDDKSSDDRKSRHAEARPSSRTRTDDKSTNAEHGSKNAEHASHKTHAPALASSFNGPSTLKPDEKSKATGHRSHSHHGGDARDVPAKRMVPAVEVPSSFSAGDRSSPTEKKAPRRERAARAPLHGNARAAAKPAKVAEKAQEEEALE